MNEAIRSLLERYTCRTREDYLNALREILQELALLGLWRARFFEHAAFYGGTALRVLHGLDRYPGLTATATARRAALYPSAASPMMPMYAE
jgi:hypothetical protein